MHAQMSDAEVLRQLRKLGFGEQVEELRTLVSTTAREDIPPPPDVNAKIRTARGVQDSDADVAARRSAEATIAHQRRLTGARRASRSDSEIPPPPSITAATIRAAREHDKRYNARRR